MSAQWTTTNEQTKEEPMINSQSDNLTRDELETAETLLKELEDSYRVRRRFARFIVSELTRFAWQSIDQLWVKSPNVRTTSQAYVDMREILEEMVGAGILEMSRGITPYLDRFRLARS